MNKMLIRRAGLVLLCVIIPVLLFPSTNQKNIQTILSTDLSLDKDPDDWFDAYLFLTLNSINPVGIILEHYATDTIKSKLIQLMNLLNINGVHIVKGVREPLQYQEGNVISSQYVDGAEFILETMRKTSGKVRLIAVGSLRNEALAFKKDSVMFMEKIDKLYFAGGTLNGEKDTNVKRDVLATDIIVNAGIPIVWIPCTQEMKQKLSGEQEMLLTHCPSPVCVFLSDMISTWRFHKGKQWLISTRQSIGEGKNLWSLPAFINASVQDEGFGLKFIKGNMRFDPQRWTRFEYNPVGEDLLLIERNESIITSWLISLITKD